MKEKITFQIIVLQISDNTLYQIQIQLLLDKYLNSYNCMYENKIFRMHDYVHLN